MTWTYKNKKTGETVNSSRIDSKYWTPEWECVAGPYTQKIDFPIFPEITYELPENDNREIKQWYIDKTEKGYHVCLSIEEKMENFHCQPDKPLKKNFFDDSECFPKKMQEDILAIQEYEPETVAIPILELQNIIDALEAGLEHTQTVLAEHDASLGRTTRKNQSWAETLEKDIALLRTKIAFLKGRLIEVATHYP